MGWRTRIGGWGPNAPRRRQRRSSPPRALISHLLEECVREGGGAGEEFGRMADEHHGDGVVKEAILLTICDGRA